MKEQKLIDKRLEWLEYYDFKIEDLKKEVESYEIMKSALSEDLKVNSIVDYCLKLGLPIPNKKIINQSIEDVIKQTKLLPVDLSRANTQPSCEHVTAEEIKQQTTESKKILIVDMKQLPSDVKEAYEVADEFREHLEEQYGHKVFLIDSSRANLQGSSNNAYTPPIYFI
jgi:hypothetical protein